MKCLPEEFEQVIQRAARFLRRNLHWDLDVDDLKQQARLVVWQDLLEGKYDCAENELHRKRLINRRVVGAMWDVQRRAGRLKPAAVQNDFDELHEPVHHNTPDVQLSLRQFVDYILRRASPQMVDVLNALAAGHTPGYIATTMGVSTSRISHISADARQLAARF